MSTQAVEIDFEDVVLRGVLHTPHVAGNAAALLLHGGPGGHKEGPSDLYVELGDALAAHGIAALRFDFFGTGESDGDYVETSASHQTAQCRAAISWLRRKEYSSLGIVGESFGASSALAGYSDDIDALVLLWPCIWFLDGAFESFVTPGRLAEVNNNGSYEIDGQEIGKAFVDDIVRIDNLAGDIARVSSPSLLIHGEADTEVPVRQSHKAYELLPEPKRLVTVAGAEHCLREPHEQALVIDEVTAWLVENLEEEGKT